MNCPTETYFPFVNLMRFSACLSQKLAPKMLRRRADCIWKAGNNSAWWFLAKEEKWSMFSTLPARSSACSSLMMLCAVSVVQEH